METGTVTLNVDTLTICEVTTEPPLWCVMVSSDTPNHTGTLDYRLSFDDALVLAIEYAILPPAAQAATRLLTILPERTLHNSNSNSQAPAQQRITISHDAWADLTHQMRAYKYDGRGFGFGITYYLLALFKANPVTPPHNLLLNWADTRPDSLSQFDSQRLKRGLFPYWARGNYEPRRIPRTINSTHFAILTPDLMRLADHFIIAPFRRNQLNPTYRAAAVLEAIGLQYLTPKHAPLPNPTPKNPNRSRWRANSLAREAGANVPF